MATCQNNCVTGTRQQAEINKSTVSKPSRAFWGETVEIGVDVIGKSWLGNYAILDLQNLFTISICLKLKHIFFNCFILLSSLVETKFSGFIN